MKTNVLNLLGVCMLLLQSIMSFGQCDHTDPSACPTYNLTLVEEELGCDMMMVELFIAWSEPVSMVGIDLDVLLEDTKTGQSISYHLLQSQESLYEPLEEASWFNFGYNSSTQIVGFQGIDQGESLCVDFPDGFGTSYKLADIVFSSDTCVDVKLKLDEIAITVKDDNNECGNAGDTAVLNPSSSSDTLLQVCPEDGDLTIEGNVQQKMSPTLPVGGDGPLEAVFIRIQEIGGSGYQTYTDSSGDWCKQVTENESYIIQPEYSGRPFCGLHDPEDTSYLDDIDAIQDHLLGIDEFGDDEHWKFLAADVNASEHVSVADIVCLRKVCLDTPCTEYVPWKFLRQDKFDLLNTSDGEAVFDIFPEYSKDTVSNIQNDVAGIDFYGIKTGDLDGNCDQFDDPIIDTRSGPITFNATIGEGSSTIQVFPNIEERTNLIGVSFSVENGVPIEVNWLQSTTTSSMEYVIHGNQVDLIWINMDLEGMKLDTTRPLFEVVLQKGASSRLPSLAITNDKFNSKLFNLSGSKLIDIKNEFVTKKIVSEFKAFPNPFDAQINVEIQAYSEFSGVMSVMDITGKELIRDDVNFQEGINMFHLNSDGLVSGIYTIRLSDGNKIFSKNIIKIE